MKNGNAEIDFEHDFEYISKTMKLDIGEVKRLYASGMEKLTYRLKRDPSKKMMLLDLTEMD